LELDLSHLRTRGRSAFGTLVAWCLLAAIVLIARHSLHTANATAIFLLAMALLIRPLLKRLQLIHEQRGRLGHNMLAAILLLLLASAFATQAIGLHALFGAFVLGIVVPQSAKIHPASDGKVQGLHDGVPPAAFLCLHRIEYRFFNPELPWLLGIRVCCSGGYVRRHSSGCADIQRAIGAAPKCAKVAGETSCS